MIRVQHGLWLAAFLMVAGRAQADTFNVEIDWMVLQGPTGHDHAPAQADLDAVVQMFACHGHTLNVAIGNAVTHHDVLVTDPADTNAFFSYNGTNNSFGWIKQNNFAHAGQPGWHYCLFAHRYANGSGITTCSSGLGEMPGDDFVVTMGCFSNAIGTPFDRAATFAHELGHNLGLDHCAFGNCQAKGAYQENYASIMSYFYQLRGVRSNLLCQGLSFAAGALFKELDYSNGTMCSLNEAALDEKFGSGMIGVDWDCSGSQQGIVAKDLNGDSNGWCNAAGALQSLADQDDWTRIDDLTWTHSPKELDRMPIVSCVTAEEMDERGGCPQPALATEGCVTARMLYLTPGGAFPYNGNCVAPMFSVATAHTFAPNGSAVFLAPGTYHETVPFTLSKPLLITCPGSSAGNSAVVTGP